MTKIWQKWSDAVHPIIEKYTAGDDYIYDMYIFPYDIQASKAHAHMLVSIGIITPEEIKKIDAAFEEILNDFMQGKITLSIEDEDCHAVIEQLLTEKIGDIGKKIHTGRSRNDQVLVATRLYTIEMIKQTGKIVFELAKCFITFAKNHESVVLPGYTHTQQAMLSSVAHWSLSFAEWLVSDLDFLLRTHDLISRNPLGTAAGFGVSFPLDRDMTAKELGFKSNIVNSLFAQASRGKFESIVLEALSQIMMTLGRFAADMLFFTSRELAFFSLPKSLTTGSSIMPQKRNVDAMELLRGNISLLFSQELTIKNLVKWTLSGYNRDLQLIKKPLIESFSLVQDSLRVVQCHLENIHVNETAIQESIQPDILAADIANDLVMQGMSFRDAYIQVGNSLENITSADYLKNIESKKSLGSPGNLGTERIEKRLEELRKSGLL